MEKNIKKEREREFIKRHFKERLKINIEDLVKSRIMNEKEFNKFLDRQFKLRFKTCNCCGFIKPKTAFYRSNSAKDNTYSYCRECQNYKCLPVHAKYREKERAKNEGYYIYLIFDKENQLAYVGASINIATRMVSHHYGQVDATRELFENNNVGLIAYVRLDTKKEMETLEVALINGKKRDDKLPYISEKVIFDKYLIDYPRLNKNKGTGKADSKLLAKVCGKINRGEYFWKIWRDK